MEQIILNITMNEEGQPSIITNIAFIDDTKLVKVVQSTNLQEKDIAFVEAIKVAIENYKD